MIKAEGFLKNRRCTRDYFENKICEPSLAFFWYFYIFTNTNVCLIGLTTQFEPGRFEVTQAAKDVFGPHWAVAPDDQTHNIWRI